MLADLINFDKVRRAIAYAAYILVVLLFQNLFFAEITVLGVRAMFVPAVIVAVGMYEGGVWGAVFGLLTGIFCDMSLGNTALFTALLPVVGFFSGMLFERAVNRSFFAYMCVSLAALVFIGFGQMFRLLVFLGQSPLALFRTLLFQTLWSLPPAALVYLPCGWLSRRRVGNERKAQ